MTIVFLILFFLSLCGIIFMIGSKLILLQEAQFGIKQNLSIKIPDAEEIKYHVVKHTKRYGFILLVIILRFTILTSHFLKNKFKELKDKIINLIKKYTVHEHNIDSQPREVSGFLKTVSDYKHKIRKIKHRIKQEEGIK